MRCCPQCAAYKDWSGLCQHIVSRIQSLCEIRDVTKQKQIKIQKRATEVFYDLREIFWGKKVK